MAQGIGKLIEKLRNTLELNQSDFGALLGTTAMSVSRWERDVNLPESRELLKLGLLAKETRIDGWNFWRLAGITPADARTMLGKATVPAAGAGRH